MGQSRGESSTIRSTDVKHPHIGVFDRGHPDLPTGSLLEQVDGTAWMGMFCLDMLAIAVELSRTRPSYEAIVTKFFEHYMAFR